MVRSSTSLSSCPSENSRHLRLKPAEAQTSILDSPSTVPEEVAHEVALAAAVAVDDVVPPQVAVKAFAQAVSGLRHARRPDRLAQDQ